MINVYIEDSGKRMINVDWNGSSMSYTARRADALGYMEGIQQAHEMHGYHQMKVRKHPHSYWLKCLCIFADET